jgi:phage terminase large subunit GpA-like protein
MSKMVDEFLKAKGKPDLLKVFVNTYLAETWKEDAEEMDESGLSGRCEQYPAQVPDEAILLTCGVDVQNDRLVYEVIGWGEGEENWSIVYDHIYGNPGESQVWEALEAFLLNTEFEHETGLKLKIYATCIDTGGTHTDMVYKFCKTRHKKNIYGIKGVGGVGKPMVGPSTRNNLEKIRLFPVGTNTVKDLLFSRLKIYETGPGYCHFPISEQHGSDYFSELTAEKSVLKHQRGVPYREWVMKKPVRRNEALDCRVYGMAALKIINVNLDAMRKHWITKIQNMTISTGQVVTPRKKKGRRVRHQGPFFED